jgi:hypothetical protein
MTAYDLAKELIKFMTEDSYTELDKSIFESANMLRQQAKKIEKLEKSLAEEEIYSGILEAMNKSTPQIKELSDEEIIEIRQNTKASSTNNWADSLAFARAILKKASEK